MRALFHFFIYSSLLISLGAVSLTMVSHQLLRIHPEEYDYGLLLLIFFSTAATYLLARIMGMWNMPPHIKQLFWFGRNELFIRAFFVISCLACFVLFWYMPLASQLLLLFLAMITLLYSLPLFRKNGKQVRLRDIGLFKIFLIVFTWTLSTVALPAVHYGKSLVEPSILLQLLERAAYILAITLPFDIRDMEYDKHVNLKTIPILIGIPRTLFLAQLLIGGCSFLAILNLVFPPAYPTNIPLFISYLLAWWLIRQTHTKQPDYFYTGYLDGTMLVMGILLWMLT